MGAIGPALVSKLATMDAVTSIISDRVYPKYVKIADKTYPLIAYKIENTTTSSTYDGPANPLRSCNVVIACIAETEAEADDLHLAVLALDGSDGTWGDTVVQGCFLQDDGVADDVVTEPETEAILAYVKEVTFLTWYVQ